VLGIGWFVATPKIGSVISQAPTSIPAGESTTAPATSIGKQSSEVSTAGIPTSQSGEVPPVPLSGQTITREQLAALGYPEHLAKVKFALASAKAKDSSGITQSRDWLIANKQVSFLPANVEEAKQVRIGRRYFNEAIEKRIVAGQEQKDSKILQEAIVHLNDFLLENFGSANAHLNLAIAYIESDQSKFALAPAFHTIVFNPEGANGWLQMGLVLAINGEVENGAAAMCVVLNIAKYSEKTLGLFSRMEQGIVYDKPNVRSALSQSRGMCPGAGWM
jgi:hypothetical protein